MKTQARDTAKPHVPRALGLYAVPSSGEVPGSRIVELFAYASSERFTGSLTVEAMHGAKNVFRLQRGNITRWQSLDDQQFILRALGESLPPEQIDLVRRHAFESNLDEFGAASRLGLLPLEAIEWIHRGATARLVRSLCEPRQRYHYSFSRGLDCFEGQDGFSQSISSLWLLCECLVQGELPSWCRGRVEAVGDVPLRMTALGRGVVPALLGRARQIVLRLCNGPESLDDLREALGSQHEQALVGTVYALLATGAAELVTDSGLVPRPSESMAPSLDETPWGRAKSNKFKVLREGEWISPGSYRSGPGSTKSEYVAGAALRAPEGPILPPKGSTSPREERARTAPESGVGPVVSGAAPLSARGPISTRAPAPTEAPDPSQVPTARPPAMSGVPAPQTVRWTAGASRQTDEPPSSRAPASPRSERPSSEGRNESALETAALETWSRALGGDRTTLLRAEAQIEKLATHCPQNASILYYLGALYHLTGKAFESETTLLRVIDIDSEHLGAREELLRVRRSIDSQRRTPSSFLKRLVGKNT